MMKPDIQKIYHKNGRPYQEVPFTEDKLNGLIREWHPSCALAREVPMKDGLRHGICRQWNDDGKLLGTFEMTMGTGISKQWHPNGQLQFEASVVGEKFNGRLRQWNDQGELVAEAFFLSNKRVSKAKYERARRANLALPAYPESDGKRLKVAKRKDQREAPERLVRRLLSGHKEEASKWLHTGAPTSKKRLDELSAKKSVAFVEGLYAAGAEQVFAADINEDTRGNQMADKLVIALPDNAKAREAIRAWCARKKFLVSPAREIGQSHLAVFLP
ncbi:MAG: hypothetical protein ABSE59_11860 [Opitutaceae bacterium]|jgi:antitoxin component YwqK of YwqJK toxin-antitoxin module